MIFLKLIVIVCVLMNCINPLEAFLKKILIVSLKKLEADGLVLRKVYPEVPPKVEYKLSELGKSLIPLVFNLAEWAYLNQEQILKSRRKYKR